MPTTESPTLPFTGDKIPASVADVHVRPLWEHPSREGVAFAAELSRDGRLLGTIENEGRGGGTWFHHATPEAFEWWKGAVADLFALDPDAAYGVDSMAAEALADRLYENAALKRDLDRKRNLVFRLDGDNSQIFQVGGGRTLSDSVRITLTAQNPGRTVEFWSKGHGWIS